MDADVTELAVDGAVLAARLTHVERCVPALEIADVWLFPPLPDVVPSSEFVLFTRMLEGDTRALFSARMVPENGSPAHQVIVEHGIVTAQERTGVGTLFFGEDCQAHDDLRREWAAVKESAGIEGP